MQDKNSDFRFIPFSIILCYVLTLLYSEFHFGSYAHIAEYFAIHPMPYFYDLKILLCGVDAIRDKLNPYTETCLDNHPYFNYPYSWGILAFLPFLNFANSMYIGISLALLLFISLYFFIGKINLQQSIPYSLLFISPAFMLGIERGNSDLLIFLLLLFAIIIHSKEKIFSALILGISMLKLFPIGAIVSIPFNSKNKIKISLMLIGIVGLLFFTYLVLMKDNILTVSQKTPRPYGGTSFGLGGFPSLLFDRFSNNRTVILILFPAVLIAGFILFYRLTIKKFEVLKFNNGKHGLAYIVGSSIFITTCLIGYNWEYRLIFLLFTIPQMSHWALVKRNNILSLFIWLTVLLFLQSIIGVVSSYLPFNLHCLFIFNSIVVLLFYFHLSFLIIYLKEKTKELFPLKAVA